MQWRNFASTLQLFGEYGRTPARRFPSRPAPGRTRGMGVHSITFAITKWMRTTGSITRRVLAASGAAKRFRRNVWWSGFDSRVYQGQGQNVLLFFLRGVRLQVPQAAVTQWVPTAPSSTAPVALQPVLNAFPLPNGPEQTSDMALFTSAYSTPSSLNATGIRIDQMLGSKWRLFGRFADTPSTTSPQSRQPGTHYLQYQNAHSRSHRCAVAQLSNDFVSMRREQFFNDR